MGSILFNVACPQCGRVLVDDFYYKQRYDFCQYCGYTYSKVEKYNVKGDILFEGLYDGRKVKPNSFRARKRSRIFYQRTE